tara:strand:- start:3513 stop:4400 length:888 start_codon:yes stop_codon:yes gene_type:complete
MKKIIFHPGFAKTASTLLSEIFLDIDNIESLYQIKKYNSFWKLNKTLFNSKDDFNELSSVANFVSEIENYNSDKNILIYSYAGIFNPYRFNMEKNLENFYQIINTLKNNYDVQILFTLREQASMLKSWFVSDYDVLRINFKDLNDFLDREFSDNRINQFLDFNLLHDQVISKTGIKPHYLFYEDLLKDRDKFSSGLAEILGVTKFTINPKKVNQTKKNTQGYELIDNKFYYQIYKLNTFLNKNVKFYFPLTKRIKRIIKNYLSIKLINDINVSQRNYFKFSNREFFSKIGIKNKF